MGTVNTRTVHKLDDAFERPATPHVVDFTHVVEHYYARDERGKMWVTNRSGVPLERVLPTESRKMFAEDSMPGGPGEGADVLATRRGQRRRMRRRLQAGMKIADEAWNELYKPVEDWDMEELARGRPRNDQGTFTGRPPKFVTREVHERAMERFKTLIRNDMNAHSITAIKTIQMVLDSDEVDARGKPIVGASAKMDAAKFLLEHVVGKPVQPTTSDISVKLQGILGTVMVNPDQINPGQYTPAHVGSRELTGSVLEIDENEDYDDDEE